MEPPFAINQRPLLLQSKAGNVLWDCNTILTDAGMAEIKRRGGLTAIAISHPHYYSTMLEWSAAFGGVPVYLHADDRQWVMRGGTGDRPLDRRDDDAQRRDDAGPLRRAFSRAGRCCTGARPRAARARSSPATSPWWRRTAATSRFMYSFPNYIPLNAKAVRRIAAAVAPFAFELDLRRLDQPQREGRRQGGVRGVGGEVCEGDRVDANPAGAGGEHTARRPGNDAGQVAVGALRTPRSRTMPQA